MSARCPYCGSTNTAEYIYGLPVLDDKTREQIKAGELILGGCEIDHNTPMPTNHCNNCKKDFGAVRF